MRAGSVLARWALVSGPDRSWHLWPGLVVALAAGVVYTSFSEWLNVSVRGSWAYAEAMPQVAGIGLSPLAQWVTVPISAFLLMRRPWRTTYRHT